MRRADRLIKIIHFLRSRHRAVTAQRIADEFDICTRTVYRDVQALVDSGAPIRAEAGVGYILDKEYYLPPITFNADELEAISLGISMVSQWTDSQFGEKAESAFQKILAASPIRHQIDETKKTVFSIHQNYPSLKNEYFSEIRDSIRLQHKASIEYCDNNQLLTSRIIRPLALLFSNPNWIIAAWCEVRSDFRHFRLDKIQSLRILGEFFSDENDKNLNAYIAYETACLSKVTDSR